MCSPKTICLICWDHWDLVRRHRVQYSINSDVRSAHDVYIHRAYTFMLTLNNLFCYTVPSCSKLKTCGTWCICSWIHTYSNPTPHKQLVTKRHPWLHTILHDLAFHAYNSAQCPSTSCAATNIAKIHTVITSMRSPKDDDKAEVRRWSLQYICTVSW